MQTKTDISVRLKDIMDNKNISLSRLAELSNISKSSLHSYLKGINKPKQKNIYKLATALNVSEVYLMGWTDEAENTASIDNKMQDKFSKLNTDNKKKAYNYTSTLLEKQNKKEVQELTQVYVVEKVAAGVGYSYGDNEGTFYYTDRTDLPSYDFATLVSGDSMTPNYENGDVVLLRQGYDSVNGDIYVIDYDGKSYVKKLYNDGTRFVLKSTNEKYKDIIIYLSDIESTYFNIVGKVIDSFKPVKR